MNEFYKYALIAKEGKKIESYFDDDINVLKRYAQLRKFKYYGIYELKEVCKK